MNNDTQLYENEHKLFMSPSSLKFYDNQLPLPTSLPPPLELIDIPIVDNNKNNNKSTKRLKNQSFEVIMSPDKENFGDNNSKNNTWGSPKSQFSSSIKSIKNEQQKILLKSSPKKCGLQRSSTSSPQQYLRDVSSPRRILELLKSQLQANMSDLLLPASLKEQSATLTTPSFSNIGNNFDLGKSLGKAKNNPNYSGLLNSFSLMEIESIKILQRFCHRWVIRKKFRDLVYVYMNSSQSAMGKRRNNILREIVNTEEAYVQSINFMIEKYVIPLRKSALSSSGKNVICSLEQVNNIFSNHMEIIQGLHTTLLTDVHERLSSWPSTQSIGDIFIKTADFLKVYIGYVNNFNTCIETLTKLKKNKKFVEFISKVNEQSESAGALDIMSHLIKPIQRIPRYKMLFDDLLRNTETDHVDYNALKQVLAKITEVAETMNERKREAESASKVVVIQYQVEKCPVDGQNALVQPQRRFIREADFKVTLSGSRNSKNMHLFLFNDALLLTEKLDSKDSDVPIRCKFKELIPILNVTVHKKGQDSDTNNCTVVLTVSPKTGKGQPTEIKLEAQSEEEKKQWLLNIRHQKKAVREKRKSFRLYKSVPHNKFPWNLAEEQQGKHSPVQCTNHSDLQRTGSFDDLKAKLNSTYGIEEVADFPNIQKKLEKINESIHEERTMISQLQEGAQDLEKSRKKQLGKEEIYKNAREAIKKEENRLKEQMYDAESQLRELRNLREKQEEDFEESRVQYSLSCSKCVREEDLLRSSTREQEFLRRQLHEMNTKIQEIGEMCEIMKHYTEETQLDNDIKQEDKETLETEKDLVAKDIADLQHSLDEAQDSLQNAESNKKELEVKYQELLNQRMELVVSTRTFKRENESLRGERSLLKAQLCKKRYQCERLSEQVLQESKKEKYFAQQNKIEKNELKEIRRNLHEEHVVVQELQEMKETLDHKKDKSILELRTLNGKVKSQETLHRMLQWEKKQCLASYEREQERRKELYEIVTKISEDVRGLETEQFEANTLFSKMEELRRLFISKMESSNSFLNHANESFKELQLIEKQCSNAAAELHDHATLARKYRE